MSLQMSSPVFSDHGPIPQKYSGHGENISPPLAWTDPPSGAKSFALIVDDPDAPMVTFTHWVIFNLPPTAAGLPEAVPMAETLPDGARQGKNSFKKTGYGGPLPPTKKPHRYFFKLSALDTMLDLPPGIKKKDLLKAIDGHVLDEVQLTGIYQKQ